MVALLIAGWPWIVRKLRRPRLDLVPGLVEPFLRPVPMDGIGFDELKLRVGIKNSG